MAGTMTKCLLISLELDSAYGSGVLADVCLYCVPGFIQCFVSQKQGGELLLVKF